MKKLQLSAILLLTLFASCSEDDQSINVDYSIEVEGESPSATLIIKNNTAASNFEWTFDKGAYIITEEMKPSSITTSEEKEPVGIKIEKAGQFTVKLKATEGAETNEVTKIITIPGHSAIKKFTNVIFGQVENDPRYGRFFSTQTGKIYKQADVNETIGPKIDLVYHGSESNFIFFENPADLFTDTFVIPGATTTKVMNYESGFLVSDFDTMTDDALLTDLTITHQNKTTGTLNVPFIVLFQNAAGQKGAIKLIALNTDKLMVDIKVQKY